MKRFCSILCLLVFPFLSLDAQQIVLRDVDISAQNFSDGMCWFQKGGKYGAMNTSAQVVIPPTFLEASDFVYGVALVKTETGQGLINKNGVFIIPPKYDIERQDNPISHPGVRNLFTVRDRSTKLTGVFYKNHFVIPMRYENVACYNYPILQADRTNFHALTGESLPDGFYLNLGDYILGTSKVPTFWDLEGNQLEITKESSSKGVTLFRDPDGNGYGLKGKNGEIMLEASSDLASPGWVDDVILFKSHGDDVVYGPDGKILVKGSYIRKMGNYLIVITNDDECVVYTLNGEKIYQKADAICVRQAENWIVVHSLEDYGDAKTIDLSTGKQYDGYYLMVGDMLSLTHSDKSLFIDPSNGKVLDLSKYKYVYNYNEGLVVAKDDDTSYLIDKNGRVVLKSTKDYSIWGSTYSEGVVMVDHKDYGYCFMSVNGQPNKYVYNQKSFSDDIIRTWKLEGYELFNKKKYSEAKDKYYQVMLSNPTDADAIISYGACLANMGYFDSAIEAYLTALEIDPGNKQAEKNLEIAQQSKSAAAYRENRRQSVWDGISTFLNVLTAVSSQYLEYTQAINSSYQDSDSDSYSSTGSSGASSSSAKKSSGTSGTRESTTSLNADRNTYSNCESALIKMSTYPEYYDDSERQEQQRIMRQIRTKWEAKGHKMYHSRWEDWTK